MSFWTFCSTASLSLNRRKLYWQAIQQGRVEGYVSPITPVNVFYIARKMKGADYARHLVVGLLAVCPACPLDDSSMQSALKLPLADYEDAVQLAGALTYQLDSIVTRDPHDFAEAPCRYIHLTTSSKSYPDRKYSLN